MHKNINEIIKRNRTLKETSLSWRALSQSSSKKARDLIPYSFAKESKILPIAVNEFSDDNEILIAAPKGTSQLDLISKLKIITNYHPIIFEVEEDNLEKAISNSYFKNLDEYLKASELASNEPNFKVKNININSQIDFKNSEADIPQVLVKILGYAFSNQISDIHIDSKKNGHANISFRLNGKIENLKNIVLTKVSYDSLIRHIKVICNLDITEHKKSQEGMFETEFNNHTIRIRVSILPSLHGTKLALRILHHYLLDELEKQDDNSKLRKLGLSQDQEEILKRKIAQKNGLLLISGPTGSGKSTLLYSIIETLANKSWNILSLEDPVEREISQISQIEVKSEHAHAYSDALKSILRQDPDMIMISEIRDSNVLLTAIQSALSGILVISTIHASKTLELILRMFELGATPVTLGAVLKFTSAQRLIPKNCPHCLSLQKGSLIVNKYYQIDPEIKLYSSSGCEKCNNTKIDGLIAVYESCVPTLSLISQIYLAFKNGVQTEHLNSIHNEFLKTHYMSFQSTVRNLLINKKISPETSLLFIT